MPDQAGDWLLECDEGAGKQCLKDERFPFIVTLSRAVNSMMFIFSVLDRIPNDNSPEATRDRLNSYLYGTATMYEALHLVNKMCKPFKDDKVFEDGLHLLVRKNKRAQELFKSHMNRARNLAVFHFLPDKFNDAITAGGYTKFVFASGRGTDGSKVNYLYADHLAAEILAGIHAQSEEFFTMFADAVKDTSDLATQFANSANKLIIKCMKEWGFVVKSA